MEICFFSVCGQLFNTSLPFLLCALLVLGTIFILVRAMMIRLRTGIIYRVNDIEALLTWGVNKKAGLNMIKSCVCPLMYGGFVKRWLSAHVYTILIRAADHQQWLLDQTSMDHVLRKESKLSSEGIIAKNSSYRTEVGHCCLAVTEILARNIQPSLCLMIKIFD